MLLANGKCSAIQLIFRREKGCKVFQKPILNCLSPQKASNYWQGISAAAAMTKPVTMTVTGRPDILFPGLTG